MCRAVPCRARSVHAHNQRKQMLLLLLLLLLLLQALPWLLLIVRLCVALLGSCIATWLHATVGSLALPGCASVPFTCMQYRPAQLQEDGLGWGRCCALNSRASATSAARVQHPFCCGMIDMHRRIDTRVVHAMTHIFYLRVLGWWEFISGDVGSAVEMWGRPWERSM